MILSHSSLIELWDMIKSKFIALLEALDWGVNRGLILFNKKNQQKYRLLSIANRLLSVVNRLLSIANAQTIFITALLRK